MTGTDYFTTPVFCFFFDLTRDVANKGFNGTIAKGSSISTYRANDLLEDRHFIQRDDKKVMAAVLDGHGGWQAAEFVVSALRMVDFVTRHSLPRPVSSNPTEKQFVESCLE